MLNVFPFRTSKKNNMGKQFHPILTDWPDLTNQTYAFVHNQI